MEKKRQQKRVLETIRITDDGGVLKKVFRYGESSGEDTIPIPGQEIVIAYECRLESGSVVDSWREHIKNKDVRTTDEGLKLVVGMGNVIEGWDMGLLTMRLGEVCDLHITSKYAFGDEGRPPKIPPKANVIFSIELLQIGDRKSKKP